MAIQAQNTKLNVVPGGIIPVVHVSQYDVDRALTFTLYDGSTAATLASGTTAKVEGTKPDGKGFQYGSPEVSLSGNVVTINTPIQMTCVSGTTDCKVILKKGSQVIGTALFLLEVERAGLTEDTDISETDLPGIIAEATEQMERAEAAAVAAALSEDHAHTSEANAVSAANSAAASRNAAAEYAAEALNAENSSKEAAAEAKKSEKRATQRASDAEASARNAANSAATATRKAGEAASSASDAAGSSTAASNALTEVRSLLTLVTFTVDFTTGNLLYDRNEAYNFQINTTTGNLEWEVATA